MGACIGKSEERRKPGEGRVAGIRAASRPRGGVPFKKRGRSGLPISRPRLTSAIGLRPDSTRPRLGRGRCYAKRWPQATEPSGNLSGLSRARARPEVRERDVCVTASA